MSDVVILITGASGLLGRAAHKKFEAENCLVYGTTCSRTREHLLHLDLTAEEEVRALVTRLRPAAVLHCAAVRFPDQVDADPAAATRLNVEATRSLCVVADAVGAPVLYISTDYVFDGKQPPYSVTDLPGPVNLYGRTKLLGEQAALAVNPETDHNVDLRVLPVEACACGVPQEPELSGVFHWSGKEGLTKYQMVVQMAEVLGLPHSHIEPNPNPPTSSAVPRPYDTRLDSSRLEALGLGRHTPFRTGIQTAVRPWLPSA
ncbi:methionine adenosyltransferase 2 subunit beta-like [Bacillus rossius redtenbacheri]|uniref:methionine adenosyltransferase 2 subunit beta-like n=1 Tax=Bacillus rossius redtenbacheri TaxID=93214 RepID=UPI002FDE6A5E